MTRKQYKRRMMELCRSLKKTNAHFKYTDRIGVPKFGTVIHGETLISYDQAWRIVSEIVKGVK